MRITVRSAFNNLLPYTHLEVSKKGKSSIYYTLTEISASGNSEFI